MGLIKFFKKMFSKKVLQMPTKKQDILIQAQSPGYTTVVLGQKLLVEPGFCAVIVAKDTVLDVFNEGTHELSIAYLPKTTKALALDKGKVRKNGSTAEVVLPKKFKCDIYFVRTEYIMNRKWQTEQIKVREKGKKKFKYSVKGTYSFQVENAGKTVELFLIDWARIRPGQAMLKLDDLVGDVCSDVLWSKKFKSPKDLTQYEFGNLILKPYVFKNFKKYGLSITDIQVEDIIYPQNLKTEKFESVVGEVQNKKEKIKEETSLVEVKEQKHDISNAKNDNESQKERKIPVINYEEKSFLKCKNCGASLSSDSIFCNKCGHKIESKGE